MAKTEVFHVICSFAVLYLPTFQIGFNTEHNLETRHIAGLVSVLRSLKHQPNFRYKNIH